MAVPTAITDLSATAASNSPAGSDAVLPDLDNFLRAIQAFIRQGDAEASDVASAATADIGAVAGRFVTITGTTTITSLGTVAAGVWRVCTFAGALTMTHNATSLILPGGANITTAAGDVMFARSLGSGNWRVLSYMRASGYPVAPTIAAGTYTPTLTAVSGCSGLTAYECQYQRIGNVVNVFGVLDGTLSATNPQIGISLPVASNFAASADLSGVGTANNATHELTFKLYGDTSNDRANMTGFVGATGVAHSVYFTFSYEVI